MSLNELSPTLKANLLTVPFKPKIKCKICNEVERKDKLLVPKWDSFCKHASCKKINKNIGIYVKKKDCYYSKICLDIPRTKN
jgi:hypothetical protein